MVKSTLNVEHKSYKNIDEQITYLYESKKIIVAEEDKHWLIDVNYITLINPYKEIFATGKNKDGKHIYSEYVDFKELLKIMKIELEFTDTLYKSIRDFERKFKNVVFSVLCKHYVEDRNDLFCINYSTEINDFSNDHLQHIYPMFCDNMCKTLKKTGYIENNFEVTTRVNLLKKIYSIGTGKEINGYISDTSNRLITHYTKKHVVAPLWVIPNALTLGEVSILFSMLNEILQNEIYMIMKGESLYTKSGNYEYKKLNKFSGRLEFIRTMRNTINHYEPLLPLFVGCINNQTKAIKSSQVYTALCELNDTWHFEPNKSQTFSTTLNINTKLTTYNIPKIRLLEMMKSYSYNKKY